MKNFTRQQDLPEKEQRQEPDHYMENGFLVFTASYHLKRGFCCGSGCRHCPYEPRHQKGNQHTGRIISGVNKR